MGVKLQVGITPSAVQGQHAAPVLYVQQEVKVDLSACKDIWTDWILKQGKTDF